MVEEKQENPTFDQFITSESVCSVLKENGFVTPTDVQAQTLEDSLSGQDVIVQAKTGSGKTLSFLLPLLVKLDQEADKISTDKVFALVVAPTRELVQQVQEVFSLLGQGIDAVSIIGGVSIDKQVKALKKDSRVVVGTPGRILDLIRQRKLSLKTCRYFVLDEADEMLSMGFLEDVRAILSRLPDKRQGMFVSATITPRVQMLANSFLTKPKNITVDVVGEDLPPIEHKFCNVGGDIMAKPTALCDLIETIRPQSAIIFCNTKSDTQLVEVLLRRRGFDARRINSDLTQAQRDRIMEKIRAQDIQFLVATDIAARGLDLDQIDLVINYSIHDQPDTYVHRTGRTGRAGKSGTAISLVGPRDFGAFHFLQKVVNADFQELTLPSDDDVAGAKLAHLYEMIRRAEIDLPERERLVARKLLSELGGEIEIRPELEEFLGKICFFVADHFVQHDAASLDEELESEAKKSAPQESDRRERGSRRGSDDREREPRERSSKERSSRERNDSRKDERRRDDEPRKPREETPTQELSRRLKYLQRQDEVRLCVGQGTADGLSEQEVRDLVVNFAEIEGHQVKRCKLAESFCFIDLPGNVAHSVLNSLNGIEYNGRTLPVEFATVIKRTPSDNRRGSRDQRGGRGKRDDRRRGGRDDRRGKNDGGRSNRDRRQGNRR